MECACLIDCAYLNETSSSKSSDSLLMTDLVLGLSGPLADTKTSDPLECNRALRVEVAVASAWPWPSPWPRVFIPTASRTSSESLSRDEASEDTEGERRLRLLQWPFVNGGRLTEVFRRL